MTERTAAIRVRHAEPTDHAPIAASLDEWWGGRPMRAMLGKLFFIHFRPTSFVAEEDGRLVGFVVGFRSQTFPEHAYVHFVGVAPDRRGRGVATLLYERFFAAARALGCREVRCVTSPLNRGSIAFHRRLGFEPLPGDHTAGGTPFSPDYDGPGEARVCFRKPL